MRIVVRGNIVGYISLNIPIEYIDTIKTGQKYKLIHICLFIYFLIGKTAIAHVSASSRSHCLHVYIFGNFNIILHFVFEIINSHYIRIFYNIILFYTIVIIENNKSFLFFFFFCGTDTMLSKLIHNRKFG